ncbi:MAG: hypothetical protein PPHEMADM_4745 [uncultured Paraburkholderia sp.]|nr:MAG: hypothetical protein PPHEMADE_4729 [uncultured Paraburkholderia sp.]CAH2940076.1 MAG: hypothetical protein PPHEMADM_4745 [uncultured Paraburkholderia sp.]
MAIKHYVIALQQAFVPGESMFDAGTIVSPHNDSIRARDKADKLNRQGGYSPATQASLRSPTTGISRRASATRTS